MSSCERQYNATYVQYNYSKPFFLLSLSLFFLIFFEDTNVGINRVIAVGKLYKMIYIKS